MPRVVEDTPDQELDLYRVEGTRLEEEHPKQKDLEDDNRPLLSRAQFLTNKRDLSMNLHPESREFETLKHFRVYFSEALGKGQFRAGCGIFYRPLRFVLACFV